MSVDLVGRAREVLRHAYAPYSEFRVGAALEATDGRVFVGCNVESASYGLTVCAERCAVFAAVAAGDTKDYDAIAIVIDGPELPSPCGPCRQVLWEFSPDTRVLLGTTGGLRKATTLRELLPDAFGPDRLASGRS